MGGFIKIPRGLFEGTEFGIEKFSRREAFIDLVQMAVFKPTTTYIGGNKITLDRGQIIASQRFLAARWRWSTGRVARFIDDLCEGGRCTAQKGKITIVTILDYDEFNGDAEPRKPKPATDQQPDNPKRFVKPTVEQIRAFCSEHGYAIDAERFFNYYESKGWVVGKSPMKNWQAAIRQWASRDKQEMPAPPQPAPPPSPAENKVDPELRRFFAARYKQQ